MQLRWVFQTRNSYDLTVTLDRNGINELNNVLSDSTRGLKAITNSEIKRININLFAISNCKTFSEIIKLAPTFYYPIRPVNVTMNHKDLEIYGRLLETDPWVLIYEKRRFSDTALFELLKLELPDLEKIKTDILAQINELSNLEP